MTPAVLLAGAGAGLGLAVIAAELRPAPPRLSAALTRIEDSGTAVPARRGADDRAVAWLAARLGGLAVPRADLALLGRSRETFIAHKAIAAAAGLASFAVMAAFLAVARVPVPWEAPAAASLAAGAGMWFFPDYDVRSEAARRRRDFRHAWTSYLQLVRLARAAGAATSEALEYAARIGDGWAFARIRDAVDTAQRTHVPPWTALGRLGEETGMPEITELADTMQVSGAEGTRIAETLAAQTGSLRGQLHADARAAANSRTTTMIVPLSLLGLGFVLLVAFPAFYQLLFST